jgi:pimeloyl-ACP methyl ester carboxylesterase
MVHSKFEPPSRMLLALESLGIVELGVFSVAGRYLLPRCTNEHNPVLLLPGFTASDASTRPLRRLLRSKGYSIHGWGLGTNVGPHPDIVDGMHRRLAELCDRYGTKISLVGWSLGGIYAREMARADPDRVQMVVTLGSPYRFRRGDRGHSSDLYDAVAPQRDPFPGRAVPEAQSPPLRMPATSIYSRIDGIVRWQACVEPPGPLRESIEVIGTHSGLGYNVAALYAVADRINQPTGTWTPFARPLHLWHLFPSPAPVSAGS